MGTIADLLRRRSLTGAFIVLFALSLALPATALAANTAKFSSLAPKSGSWSTALRPTIRVTVYDRYGIRGTGSYSVTIDGQPVDLAATYLVRGHWDPAHPDYRKLRLSGTPASDLAPGVHKVVVRIHDRHHRNSVRTWRFTTKAAVAFSSPLPADGSSSLATMPVISVSALAPYGAKGAASFTMLLDGTPITPTVAYTTRYTKFKITRPALSSALSTGTHTIQVGVTDTKGANRTYSWSFTVLSPPPAPAPAAFSMPIPTGTCETCHPGFPAAHPMTDCAGCHNPLAPPRPGGGKMTSYTPAHETAHTDTCPHCHSIPTSPHTLGDDCSRCHSGTYPGIRATHSSNIASSHISTSTFCTRVGCHAASLLLEHYAPGGYVRLVNGAAMDCDTCHTSADADVVGTIHSGSTACEGCHRFEGSAHPDTDLAHASPGPSCTPIGCHPGQVAEVHSGKCGACHAPGKTASTVCADCHKTGFYHLETGPAHDYSSVTACVSAGCHVSDGNQIHIDSLVGCRTCHITLDLPPKTCMAERCHPTGKSAAHLGSAANHTYAGNCTSSKCHGTSALPIHSGNCSACHGAGKTAYSTCLPCHSRAHLSPADPSHAVSGDCIGSGCHESDAKTIHDLHPHGSPKGCVACHFTGEPLSFACLDCHEGHDHTWNSSSVAIQINGTTYPARQCSVCHTDTDLVPIHSPDSCAKCHPSPRDSITTTWNKGCVQGLCHTQASALPMHADVDSSHDTTPGVDVSCGDGAGAMCHGPITSIVDVHQSGPGCAACHNNPDHPLSAVCSDCHDPHTDLAVHVAGDGVCFSEQCHVTDVVALHEPSRSRCDSCHADDKTPATDCYSTPGCHGFPTTRHNWDTVPDHIVSGTCIADGCHPDSVAWIHAGTIDDRAIGCMACHATGMTATTDCATEGCHLGVDHVAMHGVVMADTCTGSDCHAADNANLTTIHTACAQCHESTDPVVAEAITANDRACATCHAPHPDLGTAHAAAPASQTITIDSVDYGEFGCSSCHVQTDLRTLHLTGCGGCHPGVLGRIGSPTWDRSCTQGTCHAAGSTLPMHGDVTPAHETSPVLIASCGTVGNDPICHADVASLAVLHKDTAKGCGSCHNNVEHALSEDCADCHLPHDLDGAHAATPASETISIRGKDFGEFGCSTCHTPLDLRDLHSDCWSCHPSALASLGGAWSGGCVQGTCHAEGTDMSMHAAIDTSHTVASAADCATGACHHNAGTDVALLHSYDAPDKCATCHNAGPLTVQCATSGCHSSGATPMHDSHPASVTTLSVSILGDDYGIHLCSECHVTTELQAVHTGGKTCSMCHPDPVASLTLGWLGGCAQGDCHAGASTLPMHGQLDASHEATVGATALCGSGTGCHGTITSVATLHKDTEYGCASCHDNPDYPGRPASVTCLDCHTKHGSLAPIHRAAPASQTIEIDGLSYGKHECVECHTNLELLPIHGSGQCAHCHPGVVSKIGAPTWDKSCTQGTCHAAGSTAPMHGQVTAAHETSSVLVASCGTVGNNAICHADVASLAVLHKDTVKGCGSCHNNVDHPLSEDCADCHDAHDYVTPHAASLASSQPLGNVEGFDYGSRTCADCHSPADYRPLHGGDPGCVKCHPAAVDALVTPTLGTCVAATACHTTGSSAPMHLDLAASHTTTPGVAASCGTVLGTVCHADVANLAAIHDGLANGGCATCHSATEPRYVAAMADGKPACADCHDAHDLITPHAAAMPVGGSSLGTFGGYDYGWRTCSDCHSPADFRDLHVDSDGNQDCGACHPAVVDAITGTLTLGCVATTACHVTGSSAPMHENLAASHATASGVPASCGRLANQGVCHADADLANLARIHANTDLSGGCATCHSATEPRYVAAMATGAPGCADCHDPHDERVAHATELAAAVISINGTDFGEHTCIECHSTGPWVDLRQAHGGAASCTKCHPSPADQVTLVGLLKTCAPGGACHNPAQVAPPVAMHHSIDATHTDDTLGACNASECHAFSSNVALIHDATTQKCAACHDRLPADDVTKTCSTCHTDSGASEAEHLALHSLPDPRIDGCGEATCHPGSNLTTVTKLVGGDPVAGHTSCGACHDSSDQKVIGAIAGDDLKCATCHPTTNHEGRHVVTRDDGCVGADCHLASLVNLVDIHVAGCGTCHSSSKQAVIDAIAAGQAGLVCANCHSDAHAASHTGCATCHDTGAGGNEHNLSTINGRACSTCHETPFVPLAGMGAAGHHHQPRPSPYHGCPYPGCHPGYDYLGRSSTLHLVDRTQDACAGADCHAASNTNLTTLHPNGCATCHGATVRDEVKNAVAEGPTGKACSKCHARAHVSSHDSCTACHSTLGRTLMHRHPVLPDISDCSACHGATFTPLSGVAAANPLHSGHECAYPGCHYLGTLVATPSTLHLADRTQDDCAGALCHPASNANLTTLHPHGCGTCHGAGASDTVKQAVADDDTACATCHGSDVSALALHPTYVTTHTVDPQPDCTKAGCHPGGSTVTDIHDGGATPPGCTACHDAGKPALTLDCAAADGCHPGSDAHAALHEMPADWSGMVVAGHGTEDNYTEKLVQCSWCHATSLYTLHANECSLCHESARFDVIYALENGITACVQCHATYHDGGAGHNAYYEENNSSQYCDNCHEAYSYDSNYDPFGPAYKDWCAGLCHSAGPGNMAAGHTTELPGTCVAPGCHAADLAKLHSITHDGPGCLVCHGPGASKSKSCTDAACHPHAVSDTLLHPTYVTTHTVDPASSCTAAGCHPADVTAIHATDGDGDDEAIGCAACHAADKPELTDDCATGGCHPGITDAESHPRYASVHTLGSPSACATGGSCHEGGANVISIHAPSAACAACHAKDKPALSLTCVQGECHTGNEAVDHNAAHDAPCNDCHVWHGTLNYIAEAYAGPAIPGTTSCNDADHCHGSPIQHLSGPPQPRHGVLWDRCGACHDQLPTLHAVDRVNDTCLNTGCHVGADLIGLQDSHGVYVAKHGNCDTCHKSSDPNVSGAVSSGVWTCATCHTDPDHTSLHAVPARDDDCAGADCHDGVNLLSIKKGAGSATKHDTCLTCHGSSDPDVVAALGAGETGKVCTACHASTNHVLKHDVLRDDTCAPGGCHPASNANLMTLHTTHGCDTCHGTGASDTVKQAVAADVKTCTVCHLSTISDLGLHPGYSAHHNVTGNGCTGSDCHPATALTIHGRTGCYDSCHDRSGTPLSLTCSTTGCHAGRVQDYTALTQDLAGHVAVHDDCNTCHSYFYGGWHYTSGAQPYPQITAATDCSIARCHPTVGVPGASRGGLHTTRYVRWHEVGGNSPGGLHLDSYSCTLTHCHSPNRADWVPPVP